MSETTTWCNTPRYDFTGTEPPAPPCGHQACADDIERHKTGYMEATLWACPAGRCVLAWLKAECELEAGHDGDHDFPPRSDPAGWNDVDLKDGYPWPNGPEWTTPAPAAAAPLAGYDGSGF